MLPIVQIPTSLQPALEFYRPVFARPEGFEHFCRYLVGLLTVPNKTVQGIHAAQVWPDGKGVSRRAMQEALFESGWELLQLLDLHQQRIDQLTYPLGKRVLWLDWTYSHHARGPSIWGNESRYDHIEGCYTKYQVFVTCGVSTPTRIDGLDVAVQAPRIKEEIEYLKYTSKAHFDSLEEARERTTDLLYHLWHRKQYQKRTDMAAELILKIEAEGHFAGVPYAFDNGLLCPQVVGIIEEAGKEWVSEIESNRGVFWKDQYRPIREIDEQLVAESLAKENQKTFLPYSYKTRGGEIKKRWAFTKVLRLRKYGRLRIVIVHEKEDLSDKGTYYVTSAISWKVPRILTTWSFRWGAEVFHEFAKEPAGLEDSQCRNEESVKRQAVLSCLAQSLLWEVPASGATSERFAWAKGKETLGQRSYGLLRQLMEGVLEFSRTLWMTGKQTSEILEVLMPA